MNGYSIWLDLEKESRSSYRKIISTLSRRLDSPFFEPHCTIYSHMNINLEDLKAIITKLVLKNNQFSTSAKKLGKVHQIFVKILRVVFFSFFRFLFSWFVS